METNHICSSQPWYGIDRFSNVSEYEIYPKSAGTQNRQFVSFIPRYLIFFQNCSDSFIDKICVCQVFSTNPQADLGLGCYIENAYV